MVKIFLNTLYNFIQNLLLWINQSIQRKPQSMDPALDVNVICLTIITQRLDNCFRINSHFHQLIVFYYIVQLWSEREKLITLKPVAAYIRWKKRLFCMSIFTFSCDNSLILCPLSHLTMVISCPLTLSYLKSVLFHVHYHCQLGQWLCFISITTVTVIFYVHDLWYM